MSASTKTRKAAATATAQAASKLDALKAAAQRPAVKQGAKVAGLVVGVPVAAGCAYAIFATVANKVYAAMA